MKIIIKTVLISIQFLKPRKTLLLILLDLRKATKGHCPIQHTRKGGDEIWYNFHFFNATYLGTVNRDLRL